MNRKMLVVGAVGAVLGVAALSPGVASAQLGGFRSNGFIVPGGGARNDSLFMPSQNRPFIRSDGFFARPQDRFFGQRNFVVFPRQEVFHNRVFFVPHRQKVFFHDPFVFRKNVIVVPHRTVFFFHR